MGFLFRFVLFRFLQGLPTTCWNKQCDSWVGWRNWAALPAPTCHSETPEKCSLRVCVKKQGVTPLSPRGEGSAPTAAGCVRPGQRGVWRGRQAWLWLPELLGAAALLGGDCCHTVGVQRCGQSRAGFSLEKVKGTFSFFFFFF